MVDEVSLLGQYYLESSLTITTEQAEMQRRNPQKTELDEAY